MIGLGYDMVRQLFIFLAGPLKDLFLKFHIWRYTDTKRFWVRHNLLKSVVEYIRLY